VGARVAQALSSKQESSSGMYFMASAQVNGTLIVVLSGNVVVWKFQHAQRPSVAAVEKCHGLPATLT
jgi:hypothetical protein